MNEQRHRALGLTSNPDLRRLIETLLPEYLFRWNLAEQSSVVVVAADWRPSFLVVDLSNDVIPWQAVVVALHSSPATRRIPMIAFADNPTPIHQEQARAVALEMLISTAELSEKLPLWVAQYARRWDGDYYAAMREGCAGDLPDSARHGINLFNAGEFWEAHEALEGAWVQARPAPIADVYRGILQVGVAYYQIQRGHYNGALKMFLRAVQWLDPLPDVCHGIDLAQFKRDAAAARAMLESLGPERLSEFDTRLFKPVLFVQG